MPQNITGQVLYNDLQQFSYLVEGSNQSLLTVDVQPFNNFGPADARFAYNYLKQKGTLPGANISFLGERKTINGFPMIVITQPF